MKWKIYSVVSLLWSRRVLIICVWMQTSHLTLFATRTADTDLRRINSLIKALSYFYVCVFFFLFIPSEPLPMLTTSLTEQQCPWSLPAPSEHGKKIVFLMFFLNDTDISLCVVSVSVCVQYQKMAWRVKQFLMRSGWPISRSWEKPSSRERRTLVRTGNASTS